MDLPPLYEDNANEAGAVGVLIMGLGLLVIVAAALLEHYTKRSNFVTRWLDRASR